MVLQVKQAEERKNIRDIDISKLLSNYLFKPDQSRLNCGHDSWRQDLSGTGNKPLDGE